MFGVIDKADIVGVDIQDGGPSVVEYPGSTEDMMLLGSWLGIDLLTCTIGESCRLENVSGITCCFPGMCFTWNLYIRDFSLKFMILGFGMCSRFFLSPSIESKGLWSTHMMRVSSPRMKNLHFSRAVMQARASPSIG